MTSLIDSTPEVIGNFTRTVTDTNTVMYTDKSDGYQYILVTSHGPTNFKVQWGPRNDDSMIYITPTTDVIDSTEFTRKENPKEIIDKNGNPVTHSSLQDAISTALDFIVSLTENVDDTEKIETWKSNTR